MLRIFFQFEDPFFASIIVFFDKVEFNPTDPWSKISGNLKPPKYKEFLHKLLIGGLGHVPGVCWKILRPLEFSKELNFKKSKFQDPNGISKEFSNNLPSPLRIIALRLH